jgi:hypothetical protein
MPHRLAFGVVSGSAAPLILATALLGAFATLGCSGEPSRSPTILRPIDEPHAVAIMARVFREFGLDPVRNRIVKFGPNQVDLRLDVAAKERRFGVAYITWQDADKIGNDLPKRQGPGSVIVVRGNGDDDDVHAAVLFAADYMQDDLSGDAHTATNVAAEKRLELATHEVLQRAAREGWP